MRSVFDIFFSLLVLSIIFSCTSGNKYKKEIALLDAIHVILSRTDSLLNAADTTSAEKYSEEIVSDFSFINKNAGDTLSKEAALLLETYNGIEISFKKALRLIFVLKKNVVYSQNQANALMNDIKKNLADEQYLKSFAAKEMKSAEIIYKNAQIAVASMKTNISQCDSLNSEVKNFIDAIRTKK